ncbi:MAG: sulfite exporter TauE/SafE family protein [bacterium]
MSGELLASLVAMAAIGLAGAGHCVGMCGGISAALGLGSGSRNLSIGVSYHCGRITSYAVAGSAIGLLGFWGNSHLDLMPVLRTLAGLLLILMGCYLANWWRALVWLEKGGEFLWRRLQPLGNRFLPVTQFSRGYMLGLVWGWLPCGLVYSALAYAASSANPLEGGLMMAAFGLGTTPAVLAGSVFSQQIGAMLQKPALRIIMAIALITFGGWTILGGIGYFHGGAGSDGGHNHENHGEHHHSQHGY